LHIEKLLIQCPIEASDTGKASQIRRTSSAGWGLPRRGQWPGKATSIPH
jgi:hypothetical protein